jgi:hypothetical protein
MAEEEPLGPEREPTWDQKVVRLNAALAERDVPYAFGGAIALNYHREPRSTLDIDLNIFLSQEHEDTVLAALGDVYGLAGQERIRRELRREGQTRSRWGNTYVDLFLSNTDFHAAMAERVERQPFGEATIPVLSIEDLLICKALFDRSKDWVDIEAVAETRRGDLDRPYITGWLDRFLQSDDPRLARIKAILG